MACFLVSYDLVKRKNYPELIVALEEIGAVKTLLSAWLVDSPGTAKDLYDYLRHHIDDDDRMMVIEFDTKPARTGCLKGTNDWINARF